MNYEEDEEPLFHRFLPGEAHVTSHTPSGPLFSGEQVAHYRARRLGQATMPVAGRCRDAAAPGALHLSLIPI